MNLKKLFEVILFSLFITSLIGCKDLFSSAEEVIDENTNMNSSSSMNQNIQNDTGMVDHFEFSNNCDSLASMASETNAPEDIAAFNNGGCLDELKNYVPDNISSACVTRADELFDFLYNFFIIDGNSPDCKPPGDMNAHPDEICTADDLLAIASLEAERVDFENQCGSEFPEGWFEGIIKGDEGNGEMPPHSSSSNGGMHPPPEDPIIMSQKCGDLADQANMTGDPTIVQTFKDEGCVEELLLNVPPGLSIMCNEKTEGLLNLMMDFYVIKGLNLDCEDDLMNTTDPDAVLCNAEETRAKVELGSAVFMLEQDCGSELPYGFVAGIIGGGDAPPPNGGHNPPPSSSSSM